MEWSGSDHLMEWSQQHCSQFSDGAQGQGCEPGISFPLWRHTGQMTLRISSFKICFCSGSFNNVRKRLTFRENSELSPSTFLLEWRHLNSGASHPKDLQLYSKFLLPLWSDAAPEKCHSSAGMEEGSSNRLPAFGSPLKLSFFRLLSDTPVCVRGVARRAQR